MNIIFQQKVQLFTVVLAFLMICIGCASSVSKPVETVPAYPAGTVPAPPAGTVPAQPPAWTTPLQKITYFAHTVKWPGETVSIIAGWYTGDIENWKTLAEANPDIDPNIIRAGDKILIPENLMKTREPMPKEFVDSFYPKKLPSKPMPPQTKEEEPKLFGPKLYPKK
jgi:hypothetical protein